MQRESLEQECIVEAAGAQRQHGEDPTRGKRQDSGNNGRRTMFLRGPGGGRYSEKGGNWPFFCFLGRPPPDDYLKDAHPHVFIQPWPAGRRIIS